MTKFSLFSPKIKKRIFIFLALGNIILWLIPSNVVKLVARDRDTLLGLYSVEKFTLHMAVLLGTLIIVFLLAGKRENFKKRCFALAVFFIFLLPGIIIIDVVGRSTREPRYVDEEGIRHRHPNCRYEVVFHDVPGAKRSYPNEAPGYPSVRCVLTTDRYGFRNQNVQEQYHTVTIGDSFTEGSSVSDQHPWPVQFAQKSKLSVYNLGMSGANPQEAYITFKRYGLRFQPKQVILMIYEGNDYRGPRTLKKQLKKNLSFSEQFEDLYKSSPVVLGIKQFMIDTFSPINKDGYVYNSEILSWLPMAIPQGEKANYYSFPPRRVLSLYFTKEEFLQEPGWQGVANALLALQETCQEQQIDVLVAYAPTVAHAIFPIIQKRVDPQKFRAFLDLKKKSALPPADKIMYEVGSRIEVPETVAREFCQQHGIEFLSTTEALRKGIQEGKQLYYTYDQHWTPEGHQVVAEHIWQHLQNKK